MGAHGMQPGPMPEEYPAIAARTIGRWYGDQIAMVGDYADDADVKKIVNPDPAWPPFSQIYGLCRSPEEDQVEGVFTDITDDVCKVIEHELGGRFVGGGWRSFITINDTVHRWDSDSVASGPDRGPNKGKVESLDPIKVRWPSGLKTYKDPTKLDFF